MKQFNILVDNLPETVTIFSREYPVHTSFKNWIRISEIVNDRALSEEKKMAKTLSLCYKDELPPNLISAFLGMMTFLNRGADFCAPLCEKETPIFSFLQDADIIYSAFYSKYGIDLLKDEMHWFKFSALFSSLATDNAFGAVVNIRSLDESKIKDMSQKRKISALKKKFSVKNSGKTGEVNVAECLSNIF